MKIEIEIDDASLFTQVALIIDRPNVRAGITRVREKLTDGKIYKSVKLWKDTGLNPTYQNEIIDLIVKSEISPVFAPVLEEAIITGKVTRFSRVLSVPIPRKDLAELYFASADTIRSEEYEYTLITPMEATNQEVKNEFNEIKKVVKRISKIEEPTDLTDYYELVQPVSDTKSEIKTHRDWFWMHLSKQDGGNGMSHFRIALSIIEKQHPNENEQDLRQRAREFENTVQKSVNRYSALVEKHS